jgi:hypothetical protein
MAPADLDLHLHTREGSSSLGHAEFDETMIGEGIRDAQAAATR